MPSGMSPGFGLGHVVGDAVGHESGFGLGHTSGDAVGHESGFDLEETIAKERRSWRSFAKD